MKRRFFAFLSLLLIMAMLLPTLASCFGDNPPDPDPDPEVPEEIEADDIVHDLDYYFTSATVSNATTADYKAIKDRWRAQYIGDTTEGAEHTAEYKARVESISNNCTKAWGEYKSTKDKHFGYSITVGKAGDESMIADIYLNLRSMAIAYATVGSDYYHNANLLSDIKQCLDYAYANYYNLTVVQNYNTNSVDKNFYGNWWYWEIGIPMRLTIVLLVLENELGKTNIKNYLAAFDYTNKYPTKTAANKVWIAGSCLISALLQEDGARILKCKSDMNDVFNYVTTGDGFYRDGSFVQHNAFAYTGGYGLSMIESLSEILYSFHDSKFDFTEENVNNHYDWIMNSFAPLVYGGRLFASVRGREVSRTTSEASAGYSYIATIARMIGYAPKAYRKQFKSLLRSYMLAQETNFVKETSIDLCEADYCVSLYSNEGVRTTALIEGVTVFGNMDRVTYQSKDYAACVSMSSTRIYKYECINNENMNGWFQGDGMLYVYTKGYDFDYKFFKYVDPYFLPGITRNSETRNAVSIDNKASIKGGSAFVGGLEAGKYGMAVLDLSYTSNSAYTGKIKAKKTYFFFDDEIVCVGSGISDTTSTDVKTVIESRKKASTDVVTIGGQVASLTSSAQKFTSNWAHFTGMGGYCFFQNTAFYASAYTKSSQGFFQMYVSHGTNPSAGQYAYVLLPNAMADETAAYASNMDVQVLVQTEKYQVVTDSSIGATGYAFYDSGYAQGVSVSRPCCVFIREENGNQVISVSDPTFTRTALTVRIAMEQPEVVSSDSNITTAYAGGYLVLTVTMAGNVGGTSTITVK